MTWFIDVIGVAPIAVITAPEKRCGKSLLLRVMELLVLRPLKASNITPAALFRSIDEFKPTLLIDESDSFMRDNEDLRGIVNCGHTRDSAYIIRAVGDDHQPTQFNVWGAKALAGIGYLPDTIMDRSVILALRRKLDHESAERLRYADPEIFNSLRSKLARFSNDYSETIRQARPEIVESINDRAQDNWEPLMAIADAAGGPWPTRARTAANELTEKEIGPKDTGAELLADIYDVFEEKKLDRISTRDLIEALCEDDERPWATFFRGSPISPRRIATLLKKYGILSKTIRTTRGTPKGYTLDQFTEAFARYVTPLTPETATTPQTTAEAGNPVADHPPRCENANDRETQTPSPVQHCGVVADNNELPLM